MLKKRGFPSKIGGGFGGRSKKAISHIKTWGGFLVIEKERFPQQNRRGVWEVGRKKRYLTVKRGGGPEKGDSYPPKQTRSIPQNDDFVTLICQPDAS